MRYHDADQMLTRLAKTVTLLHLWPKSKRYRDASHMNLGPFYSRRPIHGSILAIIGFVHAFAIMTSIFSCRFDEIGFNLVSAFVFWILGWYLCVGSLWRGPLAVAIFIALVALCSLQYPFLLHRHCV